MITHLDWSAMAPTRRTVCGRTLTADGDNSRDPELVSCQQCTKTWSYRKRAAVAAQKRRANNDA